MKSLFLLAALIVTGCGSTEPEEVALNPEAVGSVELRSNLGLYWERDKVPVPEPVRSTEPAVIRAVVASLQPVGEPPFFRCASCGELVFTERSGQQVVFWFLPDYDKRFYEILGRGKPRRVEREPF